VHKGLKTGKLWPYKSLVLVIYFDLDRWMHLMAARNVTREYLWHLKRRRTLECCQHSIATSHEKSELKYVVSFLKII
jgi:hypothetical protein